MDTFQVVILHCRSTTSPQEPQMQSLLDRLAEMLRAECAVSEVIYDIQSHAESLTASDFSTRPHLSKLLAADLIIINTPMSPAFSFLNAPGQSLTRK